MSTTSRPGAAISRRTLVTIAAAGGISVLGGYALFEYSPWFRTPRNVAVM